MTPPCAAPAASPLARRLASSAALRRASALGARAFARPRACAAAVEQQDAASASSSSTASSLLREYTAARSELQLGEAAAILVQLEPLRPSAHDERLRNLVGSIIARRGDLPLGTLVNVARAAKGFGLHDETAGLVELALDSTSFLPSDVLLSFAKMLAVSAPKGGRAAGQGIGSADARATVFRILGEHIQEAMFDSSPSELAEALLSLAVYYCSKRGGAPDPALSKQLHFDIFATAGALLMGGRAGAAPPTALAKFLRAYKLFLLGQEQPPIAADAARVGLLAGARAIGDGALAGDRSPPPSAAGLGGASAELVPPILVEALTPRVGELPARDVVRCLHAVTSLHGRGHLPFDGRVASFCEAGMRDLEHRADELAVRDVAFALRSLAALAELAELGPSVAPAERGAKVRPDLLRALYEQVKQQVPSLTLQDALTMVRACSKLTGVARPGVVLELLAAEVLREFHALRPQELCDAAVSFGRLRFNDAALSFGLAQSFVAALPGFLPRQLATTLHAFAKAEFHEEQLYASAAPKVLRDFVGFTSRDMALTLWSFAKASQRTMPVFAAVQKSLQNQSGSKLSPADVSMLLWSFAHVEWHLDGEVLSNLAHLAARDCNAHSDEALLVSCLSFTRLGFARQPVLVQLYRSLYARLPRLGDSQLAFAYFLFSTSGVRDEPLLRRFLFEASERLPRLRGQDLSNVLLACSRTATPQTLAERHGLGDALRKRVMEQLGHMGQAPLLGVFLAAPQVLAVSRAESLQIMEALGPHIPQMDAQALARTLFATARVEVVHKPFLLPLFHHLRQQREGLNAAETLSCIWSVYILGFCKPKFRRTLQYVLLQHIRERRVPARSLSDVLPALSSLGMWERLPVGLRRSVWRLASEDLRHCASPPPPPPPGAPEGGAPRPPKHWRLRELRPRFVRHRMRRRPGATLSEAHQLEVLRPTRRERVKHAKEEARELASERPDSGGDKAVADFVRLVRQL